MGVSYRGQVDEQALAEKLARMRPLLDERQWRHLLGAEAEAIGWGGIRVVARVAGVSVNTVSKGAKEVRDGVVDEGRVRAAGAGRPSVQRSQPGILEALDSLIAPQTRGDPMSLLRWTTKSAVNLARGLAGLGFTASATTTAALVRQLGYRLQATFKTKEGNQHPDRDAQFTYINDLARAFLKSSDPVISVDTKKKEPAPRSALSYP